MLIDFQVTNFRSFRNTVDFSMEAGGHVRMYSKSNVRKIGDIKLLKSALLFGGNAHGKSNLIKALWNLYFIVVVSTASEEQPLITNTFANNHENTKYLVEFIKNKTHFTYELEYNSSEIVFEKLLAGKETIIERQGQKFAKLPEQIENFQGNIRKNQLALFFAQANNVAVAKEAYSWFAQDLVFVNPSILNSADSSLFARLKEQSFKEKFLSFLQAADFNIVDVDVIESNATNINFNLKMEKDQIIESNLRPQKVKQYRLITTHKQENNETFKVDIADESSGTQAFIGIAMYILLNELTEGKVLLIDEFNSFFHQELAQALLDLFNNERQKNQFVLTTHELSLMDYNLRQDQIYFAEKDKYGASEIFSLFEFDDPALKRGDFAYKKRYLNGRYGAKPIIATSVLQEILGEDDEKD